MKLRFHITISLQKKKLSDIFYIMNKGSVAQLVRAGDS